MGKIMSYEVDPNAIPKRMSREQLEWWILFGICVAGKSAKQTETKVRALLSDLTLFRRPGKPHVSYTPFEIVRRFIRHGKLVSWLKRHRIGQYSRIAGAFKAAVDIDLSNLSLEALEAIPGVGPKTARMIMLYYDPKANCVPLDRHVLKYLRLAGIEAPQSTPPAGEKYRQLETAFILLAHGQNKSVRQLDTEVWQAYSQNNLAALPQPWAA